MPSIYRVGANVTQAEHAIYNAAAVLLSTNVSDVVRAACDDMVRSLPCATVDAILEHVADMDGAAELAERLQGEG